MINRVSILTILLISGALLASEPSNIADQVGQLQTAVDQKSSPKTKNHSSNTYYQAGNTDMEIHTDTNPMPEQIPSAFAPPTESLGTRD